MKLYWLDDAAFTKIEPHLPKGRRGAHRKDDRRIIPATTICNRYHRWSRQGIWQNVFEALTGSSGIFGMASIDATHVKAHRSASGAQGGTSQRRSARTGAAGRPRSTP